MQEILSKKILGERIKLLRLEKAYAQSYVASFLNLSRSNYSQIELGNQYPTYNTLNAISTHYNKSYHWLLHGTEEQNVKQLADVNTNFVGVVKELEANLKNFASSLQRLENELKHLKNDMAVS